LPLSCNKGDVLQASGYRPERHGAMVKLIGQHPVIISDTAKRLVGAVLLPIRFVTITNLGKAADDHLRRQVEGFFDVGVAQLLQRVLAERVRLPSNLTDIVAGSVGRFKRAFERSRLFWHWQQFQLCCHFHMLNFGAGVLHRQAPGKTAFLH
jgi:hypothetical protein